MFISGLMVRVCRHCETQLSVVFMLFGKEHARPLNSALTLTFKLRVFNICSTHCLNQADMRIKYFSDFSQLEQW